MSKLWKKKESSGADPAVNAYIISKNLEADNQLVPYDVAASIAHAKMLCSCGLLSAEQSDSIVNTLGLIRDLHAKGEFVLNQDNEDVHTEIENFLVKELGDVGKRIHLGRSRNDQVLVAMRLYCRDQLQDIQLSQLRLASTILNFATKHEFVAMPGFTHMQHAMPSSVGQWASCFVESLINDFDIATAALKLIDQNPLGSAAGFGTAVPINREETTQLLGFAKTQINSIFCQNSRHKFDAFVTSCLLQTMLTLGKIANDVIIFTSQEFGFFTVDNKLTTGSSIMPQKRNLDIMEVLRANVSIVQSLQIQVQTVGLNLISGYNKDIKIAKEALLNCFNIVRSSLSIVDLLFNNMFPNVSNLEKAFEDAEIFATDVTNELVLSGMAFRDAYRQVGENLAAVQKQDLISNLKSKRHLGAPGNLALDRLGNEIFKRRA